MNREVVHFKDFKYNNLINRKRTGIYIYIYFVEKEK